MSLNSLKSRFVILKCCEQIPKDTKVLRNEESKEIRLESPVPVHIRPMILTSTQSSVVSIEIKMSVMCVI